jgi:hypothetical protein
MFRRDPKELSTLLSLIKTGSKVYMMTREAMDWEYQSVTYNFFYQTIIFLAVNWISSFKYCKKLVVLT